LAAGAAKVYGGARNPESITVPGVIPVRLDVTSATDIAAAAAALGDVTLLVNNAGISTSTSALDGDAIEQGMREMATNAFGPLAVSQAFAPILAANGGGAVVNVLSVLSWFSMPTTAMYCASKAAAWSITNSLRQLLHPQGTLVVGVHCGFLDTDMTARIDAPKLAPETVVEMTLDAIEHGRHEVLADELTIKVKGALSGEVTDLYPGLRAS
jgi:NAD(P)-dependent dehydrogenase (short-subunit alcohol dehydrogenase family)